MSSDFIDPVCVPDDFATALALVEDLGGVFRYSFVSEQRNELVLIRRVCLLTSAVPEARRLTAHAVAQSVNPLFKALRASH